MSFRFRFRCLDQRRRQCLASKHEREREICLVRSFTASQGRASLSSTFPEMIVGTPSCRSSQMLWFFLLLFRYKGGMEAGDEVEEKEGGGWRNEEN